MFHPINGFTKAKILETIKLMHSKPALQGNHCRYKTPDGLKCAVGMFIPDEVYERKFDSCGNVCELLKDYPELKSFMPLDVVALKRMQRIHDETDPLQDPRPDLIQWVKENVE